MQRVVAADAPRKIVLIGGAKSEGPGRHDYPNAIRVLDAAPRILAGPAKLPGLDIEAHPDGWPHDSAFDGASTVVCISMASTSIRCSHPSAARVSRR